MVGKCAEKAQEYQQDRIGGLVHPHEPGFSHSLPKDKKWRDKSPEYPSNHSLVQEKGICSASLGDITPPTLAPQRQPWSGGEIAAGNIYPQSLSPGPRSGLTEPRAIKAMADLLASQVNRCTGIFLCAGRWVAAFPLLVSSDPPSTL